MVNLFIQNISGVTKKSNYYCCPNSSVILRTWELFGYRHSCLETETEKKKPVPVITLKDFFDRNFEMISSDGKNRTNEIVRYSDQIVFIRTK
jgi:hypothetical protein